jgi:hypothetical protein
VVDHVVTLPRRFQYRQVSSQSIFAHSPNAPDVADDTEALCEFLRARAEASRPVIETAQVQTPTLTLHVHPGDRVISSPDSRVDMTTEAAPGSRACASISESSARN